MKLPLEFIKIAAGRFNYTNDNNNNNFVIIKVVNFLCVYVEEYFICESNFNVSQNTELFQLVLYKADAV